MRRLPLLAAVAVVAGVLASSTTGRPRAKPQLPAGAASRGVAAGLTTMPFAVRKVGRAVVKQAGKTWRVSLRFTATLRGSAVAQVSRGARNVQTLKFPSPAGAVTVGPFVLRSRGRYRFSLEVTSTAGVRRALAWSACVGCQALRTPTPRLESLGPVQVVKGRDGWTATVRFETARAGEARMRLVAKGKTVTTYAFRPRAGRVEVGPFVLPRRGRYELTLRLTDAARRTYGLSWKIVAAQ